LLGSVIVSRKAGSALQKRVLLYKKQKKLKQKQKKEQDVFVFLNLLMMLNFVIQGLYDLQYTICDYAAVSAAVHRNTTRVCQYKNYK
jgi:hypothetical protein